MPGAEVVDRDAHAEALDPAQRLEVGFGIRHQPALGDLQLEVLCGETAAPQDVADDAGQIGLADCIGEMLTDMRSVGAPASCQRTALGARLLEHPRTDRHDQGAVLGQRYEAIRADAAALWMGPAQQRLGPDHAPAGDVDLRLVMNLELVALESMREIPLEHPAFAQLGVQGIVVEANCTRAVALGTKARQAGMLEQDVSILAIGREAGDADPGADLGQMTVRIEWLLERSQETRRCADWENSVNGALIKPP